MKYHKIFLKLQNVGTMKIIIDIKMDYEYYRLPNQEKNLYIYAEYLGLQERNFPAQIVLKDENNFNNVVYSENLNSPLKTIQMYSSEQRAVIKEREKKSNQMKIMELINKRTTYEYLIENGINNEELIQEKNLIQNEITNIIENYNN